MFLFLVLVVVEGFQFQIKGSSVGRGFLLPSEMAKRGSGSGGAMPTPQADNIQSWGKFCSLVPTLCRVETSRVEFE